MSFHILQLVCPSTIVNNSAFLFQCVGSVMGLGGIPRKLFELQLDAAAATGQYNAKAAAWIFSSEFLL